jgi:hypothetical protein
MVYHELIIVPAFVRLGRHIGAWISHIYVDHPDSMAGGREIWGLPKQMARFNWDLAHGRVEAWQDDHLSMQDNQLLCAFNSHQPNWGLPAPVMLPFLALLGNQVLAAKSTLKRGLGLSRGVVEIPTGSPFAGYGLDGAVTAYHQRDISFQASAPAVIGQVQSVAVQSQA